MFYLTDKEINALMYGEQMEWKGLRLSTETDNYTRDFLDDYFRKLADSRLSVYDIYRGRELAYMWQLCKDEKPQFAAEANAKVEAAADDC